MKNSFESQKEQYLTLEDIVRILDMHEPHSEEAMETLRRFIDQCHAEADSEAQASPTSGSASHRANLKAEITIARAYLASASYKSVGRDSLTELLHAAVQDETTTDLAEQIRDLLSGD